MTQTADAGGDAAGRPGGVRAGHSAHLQLAVAVAGGLSSNMLPLFQLLIPFGKMRDKLFLARGFRANFQESLADRHIDRQFGRDVVGERNAALGFKARSVFTVKKLVTLIAELLEPGGNRGIDPDEILLEIFHVRFQIGLFVVRADQSERVLPGGH